jgi:ankyrin repeat protein
VQDGATALYRAARKGYKEVVGLLLGAGAAVDASDKVSAQGTSAVGLAPRCRQAG